MLYALVIVCTFFVDHDDIVVFDSGEIRDLVTVRYQLKSRDYWTLPNLGMPIAQKEFTIRYYKT